MVALFKPAALGFCRLAPRAVTWEQLGLGAGSRAGVRDLYAQADLGIFTGAFTADVGLHDVAMLRITPLEGGEEAALLAWRPWRGQPMYASRPQDADLTPEREHAAARGEQARFQRATAGGVLKAAGSAATLALAPDL